MAHDFISLAIIAVVAFVAPVIAQAIPKKPIPETVLLLAFGAILGPNCMNHIWLTEPITLLSDLGLAFLFLLAGYEINPKMLTGTEGKKGLRTWLVTFAFRWRSCSCIRIWPSAASEWFPWPSCL